MRAYYKALRKESYELGYWEFPRLIPEPTFRDFVGMYIAEGYKRNRNAVSLGNSEPAVIRLANHWICWFARNPVTYRVHHHADQDRGKLAAFWADQLGVSARRIRFQRKSNSGQLSTRVWRCKYGVMAVRASDTAFRARLQGWIDRLQEEWVFEARLALTGA